MRIHRPEKQTGKVVFLLGGERERGRRRRGLHFSVNISHAKGIEEECEELGL
jgi:hypothetical protein